MERLTDENFESLVQGSGGEPADLPESERSRLAAHRAVRSRLRSAMASVSPAEGFAEQLRRRLTSGEAPGGTTARGGVSLARREGDARVPGRRQPLVRMIWPAVIAAAAVIVVVLNLLPGGPEPMSAQAEFARIHMLHRSGEADLHRAGDPAGAAALLRERLGDAPRAVSPAEGETLLGACMDRFRGHDAGSYVLETPHGMVTVIVTRESPKELRLSHQRRSDDLTYWICGHRGRSQTCRIAAAQLGDLSYYVVGQAPHKVLLDILKRIVA